MNIVLTGFMASGKTEISKAVEQLSKYKRIDTDDMIVQAYGKSINDIFSEKGEKYFRNLEKEIVKKAASMDNAVIATGGGVVLDKENIAELRKNGIIFNLAPDFEVIKERLEAAAATRPLLRNQDIDAVRKRFNDRLPYYANCDASIKIISGRTPKSYAIEILKIAEEKMLL